MGIIKYLDLSKLTKSEVIELVSTEKEMRYSDIYQSMYEDVIKNSKSIVVEDIIQFNVLKTLGYTPNLINLNNLRRMFKIWSKDEDIRQIAFWINLNIIHDGVPIGSQMLNCQFYDLNQNSIYLSDLAQNKPIIILCGSITWPPFRESINAYKDFYQKYSNKFNIICLYIREAHIVERDSDGIIIDGWPVGHTDFEYPQHANLEKRIQMAKLFINQFDWPIPTYVDNFSNDFDNEYGAWPDKIFMFDLSTDTNQMHLTHKSKLEHDGIRFGPFTDQIIKLIHK